MTAVLGNYEVRAEAGRITRATMKYWERACLMKWIRDKSKVGNIMCGFVPNPHSGHFSFCLDSPNLRPGPAGSPSQRNFTFRDF